MWEACIGIKNLMFANDLLFYAIVDASSSQLILQAFHKFSVASGLETDHDQSNFYVASVGENEALILEELTHVPSWTIPFKYICCVPLALRKLFHNDHKLWIRKVVAEIKSWTVKKLSYAGRVQLVTSVIKGIQLDLSHIFIMPKKVHREIQKLRRIYISLE